LAGESIASRNARFARQAVARLASAGCAGFVISPGSRNTPLVMAVADTGLPVEVVLDERSAGFFALGWAKAACAPVALLCTSGSAGAHYLPAVIEAHESGVPLLLITADRPPEHQGIGAPQTTRQDGFYTHHTKGRYQVGAADEQRAIDSLAELDTYLGMAIGGKPGPIHLNIGFREPLWDEALPAPPGTQPAAGPPRPAPAHRLPDLPEAERGLLVVGPVQEAVPEALPAIRALADLAARRGWPVLADVASGLRQDLAHGGSVVHGYDLFLRSPSVRMALQPELVLHAGRLPTSKTLFSWLQQLEDQGTDVRHLSTDGQPHSLGRAPRIVPIEWSALGRQCDGDPGQVRTAGPWLQGWRRAERSSARIVAVQTARAGLWEGRVARAAAALPPGSSLVLASGMAIRDTDSHVPQLPPGTRCLVNRGVNGIDGLIATAAGVAAQDPSRRVRLLLGDLAFQHDMGSLALAARRPNLDIVVLNNGGGGIFEFLPISQAGANFEKFFLTPQQLDIAAAAGAFGIPALRCTTLRELVAGIGAEPRGPRVVEVMVDRRHNVYIHRMISSAVIDGLEQEFSSEDDDGEGSDGTGRAVESRKRV